MTDFVAAVITLPPTLSAAARRAWRRSHRRYVEAARFAPMERFA